MVPVETHRRAGAPGGRKSADRRLPGGTAPASRCAGAGLRFLRLLRPQDLRADRDRRVVGSLTSCWRRCRRGRVAASMILNVTFEKTAFSGAAAPLRGRHPGHFRRDRARRGARFHRGVGPRQHPRTRGGADRLRRSTGCRASRVCGSSAPGSAGSAFSRSISTACTRTTWRPCSTSTAWRCAPGTIARSR